LFEARRKFEHAILDLDMVRATTEQLAALKSSPPRGNTTTPTATKS